MSAIRELIECGFGLGADSFVALSDRAEVELDLLEKQVANLGSALGARNEADAKLLAAQWEPCDQTVQCRFCGWVEGFSDGVHDCALERWANA